MRCCPECASLLERRWIDGVERQACVSRDCGFVHWDNPVPVVAALVQFQRDIVLARNSRWPPGEFSLITGYLERGESPESAAIREVKEELGLDGQIQKFIGCYSFPRRNQLILAHWLTATGEIRLGDEIAEIKFVPQEDLGQWDFGRFALTAEIVSRWLREFAPGELPRHD